MPVLPSPSASLASCQSLVLDIVERCHGRLRRHGAVVPGESASLSNESNYSVLDRAIHRLAFANPSIQATAADIERILYGKRFRHLAVESPVFVTSLPRAGTTLFLEILNRVPGLATHSYRDMPFVLAPILWDAVSRGFRRPPDLRERAHGDGMAVGYDSPEAFEEVLWRAFWPAKYEGERIALWSEHDEVREFRDVFRDHIRKIMVLRSGEGSRKRYASKNNANIARIGFLTKLFPDCIILVPFRDPIAQAASLLRQHRRFRTLHERDAFSKKYMDDIGHLEFGELHRPIQFDGMNEVQSGYRPDTLDYWIAYWERAFGHILRHKDAVLLVSYEAFCAAAPKIIPALAERLRIPADALTIALGDRLRAPREHGLDAKGEDGDLERKARAMHQELLGSSIVQGH